MTLGKNYSKLIKLFLYLIVLLPFPAFAHLISINAITPFPASVNISSTTTATFSVTNTTSRTPVTVVNQSQFPSELSVSSSTCGYLNPGQSCTISLQLAASASAHTISSNLKLYPKPSADGVMYPISVNVVAPTIQFTVTPSAGVGGTISPNTPQVVNSGASLGFTATPSAGFAVNQWLLDGVSAQTGGTSYTLNNITANHTVAVSFTPEQVSLLAAADFPLAASAALVLSNNSFTTWTTTLFSGPITFGVGICTGATDTICLAAGRAGPSGYVTVSNNGVWGGQVGAPLSNDNNYRSAGAMGSGINATLVLGANAGKIFTKLPGNDPYTVTWSTFASAVSTGQMLVSCTSSGANAVCAAVQGLGAPKFAKSTDGISWVDNIIPDGGSFTTAVTINDLSCTGSGATAVCVAVGATITPSLPIRIVSIDGGASWQVTPLESVPADFFPVSVNCIGDGPSAACTLVGNAGNTAVFTILASENGVSSPWVSESTTGLPIPGLAFLNKVNCSANVCVIGGGNINGSTEPDILVRPNGSTLWTFKSLNGGPAAGYFVGVTCQQNTCIVAGQESSLGTALLGVSTDNGVTWNKQNIPTVTDVITGEFSTTGGTNISAIEPEKMCRKLNH